MRLLLVIMILFATITASFTAEAAYCCLQHDVGTAQAVIDVDNGCDSGPDSTNTDCPDCCLHHSYYSAGIVSLKTVLSGRADKITVTNDFMVGRDPASPLRPPQSV